MEIVTWNVNSVRARLPNVIEWLKNRSPDVVLLQETKCPNRNFPISPFEDLGYNLAVYGQRTFNGVAILSKYPLEDITIGLPTLSEDTQCRYIEAVTNQVRVASVYVPNGQSLLSEKFTYKMCFLEALAAHLQTLLSYDEVTLIGGDYNIAPSDDDVHDPVAWHEEVMCSTQERQAFRTLLHLGYADAIRLVHHGKGPFTWWDYRRETWIRDAGLRIDHVLLSPLARDRFENAGVDKAARGKEKASDHAPVWCTIRS